MLPLVDPERVADMAPVEARGVLASLSLPRSGGSGSRFTCNHTAAGQGLESYVFGKYDQAE